MFIIIPLLFLRMVPNQAVALDLFFSALFTRKGALPAAVSNFTAELHGIIAALEKITVLEQGHFTIFCDSKSALEALNVFNTTNPLALKAQQWVYLHKCRGTLIDFCWVPAHVNVSGNEEADTC